MLRMPSVPTANGSHFSLPRSVGQELIPYFLAGFWELYSVPSQHLGKESNLFSLLLNID